MSVVVDFHCETIEMNNSGKIRKAIVNQSHLNKIRNVLHGNKWEKTQRKTC